MTKLKLPRISKSGGYEQSMPMTDSSFWFSENLADWTRSKKKQMIENTPSRKEIRRQRELKESLKVKR